MAIGTSADFSYFQPLLLAQTRFTLQHKTLFPQLVRRESLPSGKGATFTIPKHGTVTAQTGLTEGVDLANPQTPTQGRVQIVPTFIGVQLLLTDEAEYYARDPIHRQMIRIASDAMAKQVDTDGIKQLDNFSTSLGAAGTTITIGHLSAAVSRLEAASEPPPKPWYAVFRPEQWKKIADAIAPVGTYPTPQGISQMVLQQYYRWDGSVLGLDGLFSTAQVARDASGDFKGGVFSKEAIIWVEGKPLYTEEDRDPSLRATEINMFHQYAYGEYLDEWGIEMYFAADALSS